MPRRTRVREHARTNAPRVREHERVLAEDPREQHGRITTPFTQGEVEVSMDELINMDIDPNEVAANPRMELDAEFEGADIRYKYVGRTPHGGFRFQRLQHNVLGPLRPDDNTLRAQEVFLANQLADINRKLEKAPSRRQIPWSWKPRPGFTPSYTDGGPLGYAGSRPVEYNQKRAKLLRDQREVKAALEEVRRQRGE